MGLVIVEVIGGCGDVRVIELCQCDLVQIEVWCDFVFFVCFDIIWVVDIVVVGIVVGGWVFVGNWIYVCCCIVVGYGVVIVVVVFVVFL